jgi:hypothetical protein
MPYVYIKKNTKSTKLQQKSSEKSLKGSNCYKTVGKQIHMQSSFRPQLPIMAATVSENRIKIDKAPTSKLTLMNHAKNQLLPESIELTHVLSTFGFLVDNPNRQNNIATTVVLYAN